MRLSISALIAVADDALLSVIGKEDTRKQYENSLLHRQGVTGLYREKFIKEDLTALDVKVGPLLTHVSLMIAAITLFATAMQLGPIKKSVFLIEISLYLLIAVACLRCIMPNSKKIATATYVGNEHRHLYESALLDEAILKSAWFALANNTTIGLTLFLLISTPILLLL